MTFKIQTVPKLAKRDPDKDLVAHKSVLDIKFTSDMGKVIQFFHSLQEKTSMINVTNIEIAASTKDDGEVLNVTATLEKWWSPYSGELVQDAIAAGDAPGVPAAVPVPSPENAMGGVGASVPVTTAPQLTDQIQSHLSSSPPAGGPSAVAVPEPAAPSAPPQPTGIVTQ
jgi:hypothetical protein